MRVLTPRALLSQVPTMHESMLWTNASGFLVAGVLCVVTGQATAGFAFCMRNPEVRHAVAALHSTAPPCHALPHDLRIGQRRGAALTTSPHHLSLTTLTARPIVAGAQRDHGLLAGVGRRAGASTPP